MPFETAGNLELQQHAAYADRRLPNRSASTSPSTWATGRRTANKVADYLPRTLFLSARTLGTSHSAVLGGGDTCSPRLAPGAQADILYVSPLPQA